MDQEVEEVSFLPGEAILNKKAVYEPSKGQRFRQVVCTRSWAICILLVMGSVMIAVAVIAAFARPESVKSQSDCRPTDSGDSTAAAGHKGLTPHDETQTYIATNGEAFPWKDLRLPSHVVPEAYNIFLHPNLTESFFLGKVLMTLKVVQDTDFIIFHSSKLNVSNVKVFEATDNDGDGDLNYDKALEILKQLEYPQNELYYVKVATLLRSGMTLQLHVDFRGSLASLSKMSGFYKSAYTVNGQERLMASTQFQSTYARQAFPCMDEPALKAKFTMSIVRDKNHISLFNTPLKKSSPHSEDLILDVYEQSRKMSTYLVAYVICDFKSISKTTESGVKVGVFAPEDKIYMGEYALDAAVHILDYYNSFFGVPFPLPKLDLIAIPNFAAGAMENWGLITYRDTAVLYDPKVSTQHNKDWVATVVAHELAHQWFGNLVTLEWWNDLWLNEGFASFVEYIGVDNLDSKMHKMDSFVLDFTDALYLDSLASSHPIELPIKDPAEINAMFDHISYNKGAALIRMLRRVLGEDKFKEGLKRYLKKHQYGNAQTADLWEALQEVSELPNDLTVAQFMDTWTKQMGYPVVTVTRKGGKVSISQDRFLMYDKGKQAQSENEKFKSPFGYKWNIPFTFTTSAHPTQSTLIWMKQDSLQFDLNEKKSVAWVKGNFGTVGFYRVNYDKEGWQAIIRQLSTDYKVFSVADRMGLFDDAFSLARAGLIDYTIPLDMSRYLVNETSYFVWTTVLSHFGFLRGRLYLDEEYDQLKGYVQSLAKHLIDAQGWEKKNSYLEENMQSLMISEGYRLEYRPVIDKAYSIYHQWTENSSITLNNGLRSLIYGAGMKNSSKADWDKMFERYKVSIVPSDKIKLLASLAAPRDARILQILLQYSLDESIVKSQDAGTVVAHVAGNVNGQLLSWRFLRQNWKTFYDRYGDGTFMLSRIVKDVTTSFNTQFDYDEIDDFFQDKKLGSAKRALEQALEVIESHIDWAKTNADIVKTWLRKTLKQTR